MFPLKRLEEEVNIISINPQRSTAAPSPLTPHPPPSVPSIVFISPFLKWLSVVHIHKSLLCPLQHLSLYTAASENVQKKRSCILLRVNRFLSLICEIRAAACSPTCSSPCFDPTLHLKHAGRQRAVREVWRFYDSFMEPVAVYKVKCRRCSGEVTFCHFYYKSN